LSYFDSFLKKLLCSSA
jgi:hypothetical protein